MKQIIRTIAFRINAGRNTAKREAMTHTISLAAIGVTAPEFL
ncbi:hypothetical protein [Pontixanthobacter gangjinensis]|nr:hypothetical protein [Pontixanthobacter gangjinensis]